MAEPAGENTNSSPAPVGGKRSAWISHIKKVAKAKGIKFGEAMKIASKSFKGGGGDLVGKAGPMGGRRTKKNGRKGGSLYGFAGGDGAGTGDLADGVGAYGRAPDATYHGSTELTGAAPGAAAGGRRSRRRNHRRRSSRTAKVGAKRRR